MRFNTLHHNKQKQLKQPPGGWLKEVIKHSQVLVLKQQSCPVRPPYQRRIQDFKLGGGGALIVTSRGRRNIFWGISCE
jgi:hypothetical protein